MNPQPDPYIGNIVAIIFCIAVIYYTVVAIKENKTFSINDNFIIGYIEEDPITMVPISTNNLECKIAKNKKPKKVQYNSIPSIFVADKDICNKNNAKSTKPSENVDNKLHQDCIDALVALGIRKKEAKEKTKYIFSTVKPPPSNVQTFLFLVFQKS